MNQPAARSRFYGRDARAITEDEMVALMDDDDYRVAARNPVGRWTVVTAWLGVNQDPLGDDAPSLIFANAAPRLHGRVVRGP